MNNIFNKLAEQAVNDTQRLLIKDFRNFENKLYERFAELIINECCDTGAAWAEGLIDPAHYDFVNKKIKEHFGVE